MAVDLDIWFMQCWFLVTHFSEGKVVARGTVRDCV